MRGLLQAEVGPHQGLGRHRGSAGRLHPPTNHAPEGLVQRVKLDWCWASPACLGAKRCSPIRLPHTLLATIFGIVPKKPSSQAGVRVLLCIHATACTCRTHRASPVARADRRHVDADTHRVRARSKGVPAYALTPCLACTSMTFCTSS